MHPESELILKVGIEAKSHSFTFDPTHTKFNLTQTPVKSAGLLLKGSATHPQKYLQDLGPE